MPQNYWACFAGPSLKHIAVFGVVLKEHSLLETLAQNQGSNGNGNKLTIPSRLTQRETPTSGNARVKGRTKNDRFSASNLGLMPARRLPNVET